jgi:hypothetical protein
LNDLQGPFHVDALHGQPCQPSLIRFPTDRQF